MPGPFGLEGFGDDQWMMPAWQKFPLLETLAAGTGLDVGLQNDAAACATAERMVGAAHGVDHAVCLYVGYGIGAGLILNGELYSGGNGNAGEIGMALLSPAGPSSDAAGTPRLAGLALPAPRTSTRPMRICSSGWTTLVPAEDDPRIMAWIDGGRARSALERASDRNDLRSADRHPDQRRAGSAGAPAVRRDASAAAVDRRPAGPHPAAPATGHHRSLGRSRSGAAAEPISRAFDPRFSAILKTRPT